MTSLANIIKAYLVIALDIFNKINNISIRIHDIYLLPDLVVYLLIPPKGKDPFGGFKQW